MRIIIGRIIIVAHIITPGGFIRCGVFGFTFVGVTLFRIGCIGLITVSILGVFGVRLLLGGRRATDDRRLQHGINIILVDTRRGRDHPACGDLDPETGTHKRLLAESRRGFGNGSIEFQLAIAANAEHVAALL